MAKSLADPVTFKAPACNVALSEPGMVISAWLAVAVGLIISGAVLVPVADRVT